MTNTITIEGIEIVYRTESGLIDRMSEWEKYYTLVRMGICYDSPIEGSSNCYINVDRS